MRFLSLPFVLILALGLSGLRGLSAQIPPPPLPAREFRGAWVATVRGIDFPSQPGAPAAKQQAELLAIIEKAATLRLNALIFQVRPMGDAFYQSDIEPWSPWLTGEMGKAPEPAWDPLAFAIKEAHARGIELHAWFNPFRAKIQSKYDFGGSHLQRQHPEWCWNYGSDVWMDPGEPGVRERTLAVCLDVLKRYDVDGLHMDDYFYPYPVKSKGKTVDFPDDSSWKAYRDGGGTLERGDWRRWNVDSMVQSIYTAMKKEKPWVRFGISPFGLWRPGFPEGTGKGALDPYTDIAADSLKWLKNGWCDYLAPQLYWPIKPQNLSFSSLFDWWISQNSAGRHIWPGMACDRVLKDRQASEILRQISITRERQSQMPCGHLHWNFTALKTNQGKLAEFCFTRAYTDGAIPPAATWLGGLKPPAPAVNREKNRITWSFNDFRYDNVTKWWLVQTFENGEWQNKRLLPLESKSFDLPKTARSAAIRAIGKTGIAGDAAVVR